ncbi:hypothetical protein F5X99DRAFT_375055 [Biscogniauxia marginata]|nr:hypothetical protein F5X99DRAFT_375055 [Biscogniauxia marginata]
MDPSGYNGPGPPPTSSGIEEDVPSTFTLITGSMSEAKNARPVHICETCGPSKKFTRAEHLQRHQLSHQPRSSYFRCTFPGCGRNFVIAQLLANHSKRHEQDKANRMVAHHEDQGKAQMKQTITDTNENSHLTKSTTDDKILHAFISMFVKKLGVELPQRIRGHQLVTLKSTLPDLLESFVSRCIYMDAKFVRNRTLYLLHRFGSEACEPIIKTFENKVEGNEMDQESQLAGDARRILDKIPLWHSEEDEPESSPVNRIPRDDDASTATYSGDFTAARESLYDLYESPAYTWLRNSILRELQLETPGSNDRRCRIRRRILSNLGELNDSGHVVHNRLSFRVTWIAEFLAFQEYNIPAHEALSRVIVLTGVERQAYATTCLQYVQMVWPDFGAQVLDLYISMLRNSIGTVSECTLFDRTHLTGTVRSGGKEADIIVTGGCDSIAEVGEQIAWLNTALQFSPIDNGVDCQFPSCSFSLSDAEFEPIDSNITNKGSCTIIPGRYPSISLTSTSGQCWMNLFGNPVLVGGYPIPRRAEPGTGIEIPLNMMAALAHARKITKFTKSIFIKGLSTILIPTRRTDDSIIWHMVFNEDGSHISFSDARTRPYLNTHLEDLTFGDLETSRHILGWSANVENVAGTPGAHYSIGWSGLNRPRPGLVFDRITITGGMFITGGVSMLIGKKDRAVHIRSRNDYTMRMKWIAKKFVVLYDVQGRRAWLVDGASALLHLVRASLKHDSEDDFKSLFLYDSSELQESDHQGTGKSASISVLTNEQNQSLALYAQPEDTKEEVKIDGIGARSSVLSKTKTNYCLKDRIEDICDVLEEIIVHQVNVLTQDGVSTRCKSINRRHLEGFDFMDIAANEDPSWPRMATLKTTGRGWVDFTRAIHAITLFGTGFGDLIRPLEGKAAACASCCYNTPVPKGQDHLAVCVPELQEILKKRGSKETTPWRLVDNIYWHNPDRTFEPCQCSKSRLPKHDRVQVLLPVTFPKLWARGFKSPADLSLTPRGAFIFGHSWRFPLRWNDKGDPEEGHPDQDMQEMVASFDDSGVGMSADSSSAGASIGSSPSHSSDANSTDPGEAGPADTKPDDEGRSAKRRRLFAPPRPQEQEAATLNRATDGGQSPKMSREGLSRSLINNLRGKKIDKHGKGRAG